MKLVISGFYGLGNTGDEAILEAIIDNLRTELDNPEITVFSLSPEKTAKDYDVKSFYRGWRRDNKEKLKALKEADLLISGGGGLLQDTYPTRIIFGPLPYYLIITFLAKLLGTKVMFFSQGIGPVNTTYGKLLMRVFANFADFITVRDTYSKELLHKLGVRRPKTVVTSDIVFAYQQKEDNACMASLPLTGEETIVGVSVRPCNWVEDQSYYHKLAASLDNLIEKDNVTPVFIPMEGYHDDDSAKLVMKHLKHAEKCIRLGTTFTPNQYLNFIASCDVLIGMRLHSLIFASLSGVPHVGISYDKKVESLLKRNGMWEESFLLSKIDAEQLTANVRKILADNETYKRRLQENVQPLKEEALENVILLKEKFVKEAKA